jgi:ubiquinol-cytochrome c reductase cytochrome b subunit
MAKPAPTVSTHPAVEASAPDRQPGPVFRAAAGPMAWADDRLGLAKLGRNNLRKVFPDHWSFLLGEVALYSFIVCILTGIFLTIWFKPSMGEVDYQGSYQLLKGLTMSEAYASTVGLSFDVRGGLLMRQMHHWAAMLFIAAMLTHCLRVFFTGAFRKPREISWLIGVALIMLGMIEGFAGYSLPDDLLSGTGLRFVDGLLRAIPLIGTWAEFFVFGGEYPGDLIIPRLYMAHILLIPGLILALVAGHLALVWFQKHTQFPGPGRTNDNVVGFPLFPVYMAKAGGFFFIVAGVIILMGATMEINPVWTYGPYDPAQVTAGAQPDWYMGFVEGGIRIMLNWESYIHGTTWSWNIAIPGLGLMLLLFSVLALYPFLEQWVTGDRAEHHLLDRPRERATRTGFGVAGITWYGLLWAGGGNDIIATQFHVSLNAVTYFLRVAVFVGPVIAFLLTKRICVGLQRVDQNRLLHGAESGVIFRDPDGDYTERETAITVAEAYALTSRTDPLPLNPVPADEDLTARERVAEQVRRRATRFYFVDNLRKPTRAELTRSDGHVTGAGEVHPIGGSPEEPSRTLEEPSRTLEDPSRNHRL